MDHSSHPESQLCCPADILYIYILYILLSINKLIGGELGQECDPQTETDSKEVGGHTWHLPLRMKYLRQKYCLYQKA